MTSIPNRPATTSAAELRVLLDEAGCLVVTEAFDPATRDAIRAELAPHMEAVKVNDDRPEDFYPGKTRRVSALVNRSKTVHDLIKHPMSMDLSDHHLAANCERVQLHVTAALEVGPGARSQILHREEDPFAFFPLPRPNLILASMWAVSDFRADNGGTLLVPGSHRWPADRKYREDEVVAAEMPAGSVLYWLGGTLHGAGANTAEDWRYGVILTYSLGWLRQEENQYLDITPATAASLDPELAALCGFEMHEALGFYDPRINRPA